MEAADDELGQAPRAADAGDPQRRRTGAAPRQRGPRRSTAAPAPASTTRGLRPSPPSPEARTAVLLVDDTEMNRFVARRMLRALGCEADVACDGEQAVEMAERTPYALVLMDCSMPVMDGLEATRRIRSGGGPNATTPIVAWTANGRAGVEARCFDAGMDAFLEKPLARDELQQVLESARAGELRAHRPRED